ncbi:uncharacterized protein LOC131329073 [Rhododendron vialii]|uniref:uncharacterized protein LOC131329073 n=1 Tax=Rhododendron vialii TaxID=182163 RepID=UPI0026604BC8|nr:uncharacterized protein LOC131329073 [Rhododendron vialii]
MKLHFCKNLPSKLLALLAVHPDAREIGVCSNIFTPKKINKLDQKSLNDLVFVKYNRALRRRYVKRGKFDPISLKNIDESNEWLIGKLEDELVFESEDLDWNVVAEASEVEEPSKVTRSTHKPTTSK